MKKYDATLKNVKRCKLYCVGEIYGDTKGRFPDGTTVRTSPIVSIENGILQTLNTRYLLVD